MHNRPVKRLLVGAAILAVPVLLTLAPGSRLVAAPKGDSPTAKLHKAVAAEKYTDAKQQADALLRSPSEQDRIAASLCYGRILLSLGLKDQARQYLATMGQLNLDANNARLMQVYQAWLAALDDKPDEATKTLEQMLVDKQSGSATAEAADVLAILYLKRGERAAAKRAVDFGLGFIKYDKAQGGKFPAYIETLLKNRLKVDTGEEFPEANKLYDQAEKLRKEGKFTEAGKLYVQIRTGYPRSIWSHASAYRIGQCLVGLGRFQEAQQHWDAFVSDTPTGPWRGQARVGLVDLVLATRLDIKTAAQHAAAAQKIVETGVDEAAKPSWDAAALDVHLRQGIVSLVEHRSELAAEAFRQAKQAAVSAKETPSDRLLAGLDRLIDAAEKNAGLIPNELTLGDEKLPLALSLGTIYNLVDRFEPAAAMFDLVLSGSARKSVQPHRSFASLGKARAIVGHTRQEAATAKKETGPAKDKAVPPTGPSRGPSPSPFTMAGLTAAKAAYGLSLTEKPDAAWHEETLREAALLIEELAEMRVAAMSAAPPANDSGKKPPSPARGRGAGGEGAAAGSFTHEQLRAALEAARSEALPLWVKLISQFPKCPHLPEALYHAGVLYSEGAKPDPEKSVAAFERLVREFPKSPWTGDAHVRLIDVCLEQQFDLPAAEKHAQSAVKWLESVDKAALEKAARPLGDALSLSTDHRPLPTAYSIYLRAGLVEYLNERCSEAVEWFGKAKPFAPRQNLVVIRGHIPTGIEKLIGLATTGKFITPDVVRKGGPKTKLILMLADVYHEGEQWQKSLDLYSKVVGDASSEPTIPQKSWALFKRGKSYYCLEGEYSNPDAAYHDYIDAVQIAPKASWADKALFLAANIQWNHRGDMKQAIGLWRRLLRTYPDSREADRSAYYIGVVCQWSNQPEEAKLAYQEFLEKRPGSRFAREVRQRLEEVQAEAGEQTKAANKARATAN